MNYGSPSRKPFLIKPAFKKIESPSEISGLTSRGGTLGGEVITAGIGFKYKGYLEDLYKAGYKTAGNKIFPYKAAKIIKNDFHPEHFKSPMPNENNLITLKPIKNYHNLKPAKGLKKAGKNLTKFGDNIVDDTLKMISDDLVTSVSKEIGLSKDETIIKLKKVISKLIESDDIEGFQKLYQAFGKDGKLDDILNGAGDKPNLFGVIKEKSENSVVSCVGSRLDCCLIREDL